MVSYEPDYEALAEARLLSIENGSTLKEIAADAFSTYALSVKDARTADTGEL